MAVLLLAVALVYGNSLFSGFVWDDESIVVNRGEFFADSSNITTILSSEDSTHVYGKTNPYYRPLNTLSYMLDYHLWGHQPFGYHLENLLLHALAVVLLFLLVDSVFDDRFLAFTTSILFALYPVNSEAVNFVSARNNILCTGLVFASLLTLWKSRKSGRQWALGALWLVLRHSPSRARDGSAGVESRFHPERAGGREVSLRRNAGKRPRHGLSAAAVAEKNEGDWRRR